MARCRSGLLLRLDANSSNGRARQPGMVRGDGWTCLWVRTMAGRKPEKKPEKNPGRKNASRENDDRARVGIRFERHLGVTASRGTRWIRSTE